MNWVFFFWFYENFPIRLSSKHGFNFERASRAQSQWNQRARQRNREPRARGLALKKGLLMMFFQSKTFINELMPLTPIDSQEIWLALNKTWERTIHWAFTPFFNILCSSNSMKDLEGSLSISFAYCSFTVTYENILNVFFFSCMGLSYIFGP